MECAFDAELALGGGLTVWDGDGLAHVLSSDNPRGNRVRKILDEMGVGSARSQALPSAITSGNKLLHSDHAVYIAANGIYVLGFLKMENGSYKEVQPLCVLDFYVHESKQRCGVGKELFVVMVEREGVEPRRLGYDRPSPKLLGFLRKHYGLKSYLPQANNFVVYKKYFDPTIDPFDRKVEKKTDFQVQKSRNEQVRSIKEQKESTPPQKVIYKPEMTNNTQQVEVPHVDEIVEENKEIVHSKDEEVRREQEEKEKTVEPSAGFISRVDLDRLRVRGYRSHLPGKITEESVMNPLAPPPNQLGGWSRSAVIRDYHRQNGTPSSRSTGERTPNDMRSKVAFQTPNPRSKAPFFY